MILSFLAFACFFVFTRKALIEFDENPLNQTFNGLLIATFSYEASKVLKKLLKLDFFVESFCDHFASPNAHISISPLICPEIQNCFGQLVTISGLPPYNLSGHRLRLQVRLQLLMRLPGRSWPRIPAIRLEVPPCRGLAETVMFTCSKT